MSFSGSTVSGAGSTNRDLLNNNVGRKFGKKAKTRDQLAKAIKDGLQKGQLITIPDHQRRFAGAGLHDLDPIWPIVVLKESASGRNEIFCDVSKSEVFDREEFVKRIRANL